MALRMQVENNDSLGRWALCYRLRTPVTHAHPSSSATRKSSKCSPYFATAAVACSPASTPLSTNRAPGRA